MKSRALLSAIAWGLSVCSSALAAEPAELINNQVDALAYWTPARLKNAKSLTLPKKLVQLNLQPMLEHALMLPQDVTYQDERPPTIRTEPNGNNRLFQPEPLAQGAPDTTVIPMDYGTAQAQFTSSRVHPLYTGDARQYSADVRSPFNKVGKLFFTIPGVGNFFCSAAVILPRVILTAGHCVHSGNGAENGYYTNFVFVPAYRDGVAPFGAWNWRRVNTTAEAYSGGGTFPNAADYAMIIVANQPPNRIGDVLGWFGYQTNSLNPNHVTILGYAFNLDNGEKMHRVDAQSFAAVAPNTVVYGSDMREGSSGSPWIQNIGPASVGQTGGLNSGHNRVVGVTSYGSADSNVMVLGSSVLNDSFVALVNWACSVGPRVCQF